MNTVVKGLVHPIFGRTGLLHLAVRLALPAFASAGAATGGKPATRGATVDLSGRNVQFSPTRSRWGRAGAKRSELGEHPTPARTKRALRLWRVIATSLLVSGAGFAGRAQGCSQCICGTPFPATVVGGVVPMQFTYGFEERYLSKTSGLDEGPGQEEEREHRVAGFALWRPWNRLALVGRLPYNVKQITQHLPGPGTSDQRSSGVGDAELLALAGVGRTAGRHPMTLGLVLGGTIPTGSNEARDANGERLDIHLQPGTGAWSGTAGLNLATSRSTGTWEASLLGRTSGTSTHGYRYGNVLLYNAGFTSSAWRGVRLLAQVNGRSAERDRLEDGTVGENTGGMVTYAAPGLRWQSGAGLMVEGSVQVPMGQRLYGDQTEHATGRVTLSLSR